MSLTWIPFYEELAERLLGWRERQGELIEVLRRGSERGIKVVSLMDQSGDVPEPLLEIDPFTFFASMNRGTTPKTKRLVAELFKDEFGIIAEVPADFDGIPHVDNMSSWFFGFRHHRRPDDIASLWDLFEQAVRGGPDAVLAATFDRCLRIHAVGPGKLTSGLFWVAPRKFIPIDSRSRTYFESKGIDVPRELDWAAYASVLATVREHLGDDFARISLDAYLATREDDSGGDGTSRSQDAVATGDGYRAEGRRYWLFQANPNQYNLAEILRSTKPGDTESWGVTRYAAEMAEGDGLLLWQSGSEAGVYATATLTGRPVEQEGPFPYSGGESTRKWHKVPYRYDLILNKPLLRAELKEDPVLANLAVIRSAQASNFKVEPAEWDRLMALLLEPGAAVGVKGTTTAEPPSYWKISPGAGGARWDRWRREGIVAVGWGELGSLEGKTREEFDAQVDALVEKHGLRRGGPEQAWRFAHIPVGARVVANVGTHRVLGIGTVIGAYEFVDDPQPRGSDEEPFPHRLRVRWDDTRERAVRRGGWRKTLIKLSSDDFQEIVDAPSLAGDEVILAEPTPQGSDVLAFDDLVARITKEGLYFSDEIVAAYLLALQAKRFVILSGISGTGKTALAIGVARALQGSPAADARPAASPATSFVPVKPYNLQYRRIMVPAALTRAHPGFIEAAEERRKVLLRYPGGEQELAIHKPKTANTLFLLLSGDAVAWFQETYHEGDAIGLSIEPDATGAPGVVRVHDKDAPDVVTVADARRYEVVAVRPDWTDNHGLLGYYNPLTKEYVDTPFLRTLLAARDEVERSDREGRPPKPYFVILDEMNLARVEHYFSDFLSCMESEEAISLHDDVDGEALLDVPARLQVPKNLFFTGTVNVDESTYMFSPKVLDRAFTLEFNEVDLASYGVESEDELDDSDGEDGLRLERFEGHLELLGKPAPEDWTNLRKRDGEAADLVAKVNSVLQATHRHFGYRVANEIARFLNLAFKQAGSDDTIRWAALDLALLSKALPKLHGTQQDIEDTLLNLFKFAVDPTSPDSPKLAKIEEWELAGSVIRRRGEGASGAKGSSGSPRLPRTATKLFRMVERLRARGFTSYIE